MVNDLPKQTDKEHGYMCTVCEEKFSKMDDMDK